MSTSHTGQLVPWPLPIGPPTLPAHALRAAQATTLAAPRLRYDPFSRLMFFTVNVLYGRPPSLTKFLVLEHLARIPYQTWERVAQRAIARTEGRSHLALRIMNRVVEARAQQDNEQFHLLIIDETAHWPWRRAGSSPLPDRAPTAGRPVAHVHLAAPSDPPRMELPAQRKLRRPRRTRIHALRRLASRARPRTRRL